MAGDVEPSDDLDAEETLQYFTDPNLAFSLAERSDESAVVRVHLSLEPRPPWLGQQGDIYDFFVKLGLALTTSSRAVDDWEREMSSFPER